MKLLKYLCCIGLCLLMFMPRQAQAEETQEIDVYEIVFGHIEDAYEWHITDIGDASIRIPLPVIVKSSSGWHIFSSARLRNQARYEGLYIAPDGEYKNKIVDKQQAATNFQKEYIDKDYEEEDEVKIIRTKKFDMKPMYPEDACVQMELLGHDFFVFVNAEDDNVNVVYKRKGNTYGLIEPEF